MDSIVTSIIGKFEDRAIIGKQKYGTDLDRKDLTREEWINHAQEELMDGILYLEKLKQETKRRDNEVLNIGGIMCSIMFWLVIFNVYQAMFIYRS